MAKLRRNDAASDQIYAAAAKSSGGEGFAHEDKVTAFYLAMLLGGMSPFGEAAEVVARVELQTKVDGWHLDDILLELTSATGRRRCSISVKSNAQLTEDSVPAEFVRQCWQQMLEASPMDPDRDMCALAVAGASAKALTNFDTLRGLAAAGEAQSLQRRLAVRGFANDKKRRLAQSFSCPRDLAQQYPSTATSDVARVIARTRLIDFDFSSANSRCYREAIRLCEQSLRHGTGLAAARLWEELCALARDLRPKSAAIDRPMLVARLRSRHDLAHFPDHAPDWDRLSRYTQLQLDVAGRWTLACALSLLRLPLRRQIDQCHANTIAAVGRSGGVALVGRSGDGKSVLARQWLASGSPRVWLDARLFDVPPGGDSLLAAEDALRLTHPLPAVLSSAGGSNPRLVVDGIGRLADQAIAIVVGLVAGAMQSGWQVVLTVQDDDWDRAMYASRVAGLPLTGISVEPLTDAELRDVALAFPMVRSLIAKPAVRQVLARPKYLDVVIRGTLVGSPGKLRESKAWTGEADIAEWCWRHVIEGSPPKTVQSAAAKQLASKQADSMRDSVGEDELDPAHLPAIDTFLANGVCRKVTERLIFEHDLLGDWGCQRILLAQPSLSSFLRTSNRGTSPAWLRGCRLWALDVLERQGNVETWWKAVEELAHVGEVAASDRVLEAVVFTAGAATYLQQVWPKLCKQGKVLRRLLERFLRAATSPSPMALQILATIGVDETHGELRAWAAMEYRVPSVVYWPAVLRILHHHAHEAIRLAPDETARIVDLWLRTTGERFPARKEAAELSLAVAQHVHQVANGDKSYTSEGLDTWSLCHKAEEHAYAAVLAATPIFPKEVSEFARRAAGRTSEAATHDEEGVVYAEPWPDGPSQQVSSAFRNTVLQNQHFHFLAETVPAIASEVLLAVLIESPELLKHPGMLTGPQLDDDAFAIEDVHGWSPTFFTRGPFLAFLQTNPQVAIDAILHLVNFATERWNHRPPRKALFGRRYRGDHSHRVQIDGGRSARTWVGDADVYFWYLGDSRAPHPVTSALMALEKWLYDRIDQGEDLSPHLTQIKRGARSVAFGGLLSAVGRYRSELLAGPLSFLLRAPAFLYAELAHTDRTLHDATLAWQIGLLRERHLIPLMKPWYEMPHRKKNLFKVAQFLFLHDQHIQATLTACLPGWRKQLRGKLSEDQRSALEACVKAFDRKRWSLVTLSDRHKAWEQQQTPEEAKVGAAALEDANDTIFAIGFPHRCRTLLDRGERMSEEELQAFWQDLNRLHERIGSKLHVPKHKPSHARRSVEEELKVDQERSRYRWFLDGMMGGVAVFLLRYPEYLDPERSRKAWILRQLRRIPRMALPPGGMDSLHADENNFDRWECFFAEVVVAFLRKNPRSFVWRVQAGMLATGFHYSPIRQLLTAAHHCRVDLDGVFDELVHLVLRWAAVRHHLELVRNGFRVNVDIQAEWNAAMNDFLSGHLLGPRPSVLELVACPAEVPVQPMPPPRFRRGLDLPLVQAAFHDILRPESASSAEERSQWLALWKELLAWRLMPVDPTVVVTASDDDDEDDHDEDSERYAPSNSLPYPSDRWLLDRIAHWVVWLGPSADAMSLWRPVLDLVPARASWTEHFLLSFAFAALHADPTPPSLTELWKPLLDYAESSMRWARADHNSWANLLAFDHLLHDAWEERHGPLFQCLQPYLQRYIHTGMSWSSELRDVLGLLRTPAAGASRLQFLPSIAHAIKTNPGMITRDESATVTARFMDFCLRTHPEVVDDSTLFGALAGIVGALVVQQEPLALDIQDRLRRR